MQETKSGVGVPRTRGKAEDVATSMNKSASHSNPQPGPSGIERDQLISQSVSDDSDTENEMAEEDKCCVCKKFNVQSKT